MSAVVTPARSPAFGKWMAHLCHNTHTAHSPSFVGWYVFFLLCAVFFGLVHIVVPKRWGMWHMENILRQTQTYITIHVFFPRPSVSHSLYLMCYLILLFITLKCIKCRWDDNKMRVKYYPLTQPKANKKYIYFFFFFGFIFGGAHCSVLVRAC